MKDGKTADYIHSGTECVNVYEQSISHLSTTLSTPKVLNQYTVPEEYTIFQEVLFGAEQFRTIFTQCELSHILERLKKGDDPYELAGCYSSDDPLSLGNSDDDYDRALDEYVENRLDNSEIEVI